MDLTSMLAEVTNQLLYANKVQLGAAVMFCLWLLNLLYELLRVRWPSFYFSLSETASLYISVSPWRFIGFRVIPIILVTFPILGILARGNPPGSVIFTGLLIGTLHGITTNGLAIYKLSSGSQDITRYTNTLTQLSHHVVMIAVCIVSGLVAGILATAPGATGFIPTLEGMVDNVWSTVFVALLAVYGYRVYNRELDEEGILKRATDKIPKEIIAKIKASCAECNGDFELALAACVVESLQRPSWIRKIERVKSWFIKSGTYGIMQVQSDGFVTDLESVEIAVPRFFSGTRGASFDVKRICVTRYNATDTYLGTVFSAYSFLCEAHGVDYGQAPEGCAE